MRSISPSTPIATSPRSNIDSIAALICPSFLPDCFMHQPSLHPIPSASFARLNNVANQEKAKGQERLDSADRLYSAAVSRFRQPVESLFNWIQEKTGIECASKVRSFRGLLVHVFARLAAAMFLLNARPQSA